MLLTVGGSGSNFKTLTTGTYDAMCIDVVLPIMKQYTPQDRPKSTVMFVFEVNQKREKVDGTTDSSNYLVFSKNLTMTLNEKGHLLPFLSGWLGGKPSIGEELNLEDFVGKAAKLMITEEQKKSGAGTFACIVKALPSDVTFETDPNYERKDPTQYSDVQVKDEKEDNAPF